MAFSARWFPSSTWTLRWPLAPGELSVPWKSQSGFLARPGFGPWSATTLAAEASTCASVEPRCARMRTTSWSPWARLLCWTTDGTPCTQRRYWVFELTAKDCPEGWPTIRRSARWLPPATSTSSEAEFGGGVAGKSPLNWYSTRPCLLAAIEPVAPRPTAATAVRARKSMRNLICTLLGRERRLAYARTQTSGLRGADVKGW